MDIYLQTVIVILTYNTWARKSSVRTLQQDRFRKVTRFKGVSFAPKKLLQFSALAIRDTYTSSV